jgi:hypothetical protein
MPTTTLREYLTRTNQTFTVHPKASCFIRNVPASQNWPMVEEWSQWGDFNMENIDDLLGPLLDTTFDVADPPPPLESSKILLHETQFEFALIQQNNVMVNEALRVACDYLGLEKVEWSRGGNDTRERTFPDWSGVSASDYQRNILPGDSKLNRDFFRAERIQTNDNKDSGYLGVPSPLTFETNLTRSCLQQVNNEAAFRKLRYCYVITNQELFLCRRTQDSPPDASIAA